MDDFDLDLRTAEDHIEVPDDDAWGGSVVLAILNGRTDPEEWIEHIEAGDVLFFAVEGDLNELAAGFARDIKDMEGNLVRFREFLVVTPPGITIDTERLS